MSKVDFIYPLPTACLHKRYNPIFHSLKKGLSATITGLPLSSRSAYLKFIIDNSKVLNSFIDTKKFKFVVINSKSGEDGEIFQTIVDQVVRVFGINKEIKTDPLLIQSIIERHLREATNKTKIVIFIPDFYKTLKGKTETIELLTRVNKINKHNPSKAGVLLVVTASLKEMEKVRMSFPTEFCQIITEFTSNFSLFNNEEIEYTRKRLEYFRNVKIENDVHEISSNLAGGHYLIYKTLTTFDYKDLRITQKNDNHPFLDNLIKEIKSGCSNSDNTWKTIPLLKTNEAKTKRTSDGIIPLTAQEHDLLNLLRQKQEYLVTRDQVAEVLWKEKWHEKYSDWAIDKLISNLKKKIVYSRIKIITYRNQGYKLVKYDN